MSGLALDRNHEAPTAGQKVMTGEHAEHDHDHPDAIAPLQNVGRPRSSRGLLRKDTPAVLDKASMKKGLLMSGIHQEALVAEEESDEDEDNTTTKDTITTAIIEPHSDLAETILTNNMANDPLIVFHKRCPNKDDGGDFTGNTVDGHTSVTRGTILNEDTSEQTGEDTERLKDVSGNTVDANFDGTKPKWINSSNGSIKGCVKMDGRREEIVEVAGVKVKKPIVTFKERQEEGFHAHTKSGTKVLMRKETPASLPSVPKVKATQRFRNTGLSLAEENDHESVGEEEDLPDSCLTGACGEG